MPFNLIMKRKVFARVQVMCDDYEDKFQEKVATARVVNVLLAEALIHRELIPKGFIKENYGCDDPIADGFTPKARRASGKVELTIKRIEITKTLRMVIDQWNMHDTEWQKKWVSKAEKLKDTIPEAQQILRKWK